MTIVKQVFKAYSCNFELPAPVCLVNVIRGEGGFDQSSEVKKISKDPFLCQVNLGQVVPCCTRSKLSVQENLGSGDFEATAVV